MKFIIFILLLLGVLDGFIGGSTMLKELLPYSGQTRFIYNIAGLIVAIILSSIVVGTIIDHLENHVITKVKLKKSSNDESDDDVDDGVEDVDFDDLEELGKSEETVKL